MLGSKSCICNFYSSCKIALNRLIVLPPAIHERTLLHLCQHSVLPIFLYFINVISLQFLLVFSNHEVSYHYWHRSQLFILILMVQVQGNYKCSQITVFSEFPELSRQMLNELCSFTFILPHFFLELSQVFLQHPFYFKTSITRG